MARVWKVNGRSDLPDIRHRDGPWLQGATFEGVGVGRLFVASERDGD
jgi:hypothetical protein